jgi:hypothetical protein
MTTQDLHKGEEDLRVYLSPGDVVTFKSTRLDLSLPGCEESKLYLWNNKSDVILRITLRGGQNKIFCNDCAWGSWGQERSFDLDGVVRFWGGENTISVHISLTDSKLTRCQILVNLTTVGYFDSRCRGSVQQLSYAERSVGHFSILSHPLRVVCCAMSELYFEEQEAIKSGRQVDISQCSFIAH